MATHWRIEDPAAISGPVEQGTAFVTALRYLMNRISLFTALPAASLDKPSLKARLNEIGQGEVWRPGTGLRTNIFACSKGLEPAVTLSLEAQRELRVEASRE